MKVNVQSIHFDADKKLLDHIQKRCDKLDVFFERIIDADVYLKIEKDHEHGNKVVEIKLHVPGEILIGISRGDKFEEAMDTCTEKVKVQIKKYKEKLLKKRPE